MFCVSNLFLLYLLLLCTVIQSIPTTNLQHRYQRNALTKFPQHGDFNLVLQNGDDFLEFEICCKNSNGCLGNFTVCFATSDQKQTADTFGCYSSKTCAYQIKFKDKPNFVLNTQKFTTEEQCFTGKISDDEMTVSYLNDKKSSPGCPLAFDSENRLKLDIRDIPFGVIVTALNAHEYVKPTTSTISPTPSGAEKMSGATEAVGMADALKYGLIGIVVFLFILIIIGVGVAIYLCRKSKKNAKPVPAVPAVVENQKPEVKAPDASEAKKNEEESKKSMNNKKSAPSNITSSFKSKEPATKPSALLSSKQKTHSVATEDTQFGIKSLSSKASKTSVSGLEKKKSRRKF